MMRARDVTPISLIVGVAAMCRDVFVHHRAVRGLGVTGVDRLGQACYIDSQQDIGRTTKPFGLQAFSQVLINIDHVDFDSVFIGRAVDNRRDQLGLALGI